jgi:hypothetical protein
MTSLELSICSSSILFSSYFNDQYPSLNPDLFGELFYAVLDLNLDILDFRSSEFVILLIFEVRVKDTFINSETISSVLSNLDSISDNLSE